ncbi:MAG TPA: polysaccharide deacetylase family protein [Solirubrobacterales bacterium]|nr:polysaccharide deacetylase family protein [Solirubrobacterales bacterium]
MSARRKIRRAIPRPLRQRLYDWSPSRRRRWREVPGLESLPAADRVALTFDDGPDPRFTPPLLDALERADATATFFVVGERLAGAADPVREIEERGHEIALHGMSHRRHDGLDKAGARAELSDGLAAIEAAGLARPRWYRPPFGGSSPALARCCHELDLELAYWSAWGQDWEAITAAQIAALVLRDLRPGGIVLLHDSPLYAERDDATPTIDSIPLLAEALRSRGLRATSIGSAYDAGRA